MRRNIYKLSNFDNSCHLAEANIQTARASLRSIYKLYAISSTVKNCIRSMFKNLRAKRKRNGKTD